MAIMKEAEWVGPHHDNGVMSRYDIICIHTIVGNPPAHPAHFSTRADGHIYQSRDTHYRSAANLNGNYRIIAIENDDHGSEFGSWDTNDGHDVPAFTPEQCEAIAQICAWAYKTHGIPLVACPDSKSTSRGVAYHRQGIKGNWTGYAYPGIVSGGELWSEHTGKVCPGDARITQLLTIIIPRARILAGLDVPSYVLPGSEEDMTVVNSGTEFCGLLFSSGKMIDISTDSTARKSAQDNLNSKAWQQLLVSKSTWDELVANSSS